MVGRPGREAVARLLPGLRSELGVDLAVVDCENAAGGAGLTGAIAQELNAVDETTGRARSIERIDRTAA